MEEKRENEVYDEIIESNLEEFYQSPYYLNQKRKKNNIKKAVIALLVVLGVYLGFVYLGGMLLAGKEKAAATDLEKLEVKLEQEYDIVINTGDKINNIQTGYTIAILDSATQTYEALKAVESVFGRLSKDFIDEIAQTDEGKHIEINITGSMANEESGVFAAGLTSFGSDRNVVRIDATSGVSMDLQKLVAHEIFHLIDYEMRRFNPDASNIDEWEMYNPPEFEYGSRQASNGKYLISTADISNTYFVSAYSKESVFEDRAETFSQLLGVPENGELPVSYESKYVIAKSKEINILKL